jgi:hypothetical protein
MEGVVDLQPVDRVLPGLLSRASATGTPLTLVLARPGAPTAVSVPPGSVADLASALAVSLAPDQHLLSAGPGHLAVVLAGGPGAGRRHAERLMQRAAVAGAPLLTWAMACHPRDGSSASALLSAAGARLQQPVTAQPGTRRGGAALWAGVAAALLAGLFAYVLGTGHGSSPSARADDAGSGQGSVAPAGGTAPSSGGSDSGQVGPSVQTSVPPSWFGGAAGGSSAPSGTSGGSATGTSGPGQSSGPGAGSSGGSFGLPTGGGQQSTGSTPTTTLPLGITTTTIPVTTTTTPSGGTNTTGTTTTGTQCTGLLQGLICTVNGLLGGGH